MEVQVGDLKGSFLEDNIRARFLQKLVEEKRREVNKGVERHKGNVDILLKV